MSLGYLTGVCAYVRFCTTGIQYLFRWLGQELMVDKDEQAFYVFVHWSFTFSSLCAQLFEIRKNNVLLFA